MSARLIFRTLLFGASLLCALEIPAALAQDDPLAILPAHDRESSAIAREWLNSSDPRLRAWGAYLVLQYNHTSLAPDLLAVVASYQSLAKPDKDQHDAMLPVLDALIQLNVSVPADVAANLLHEFPAAALILLSRAGSEADEHLLNFFRIQGDSRGAWLAAGNLLAVRRASGFAAALLSHMTVEMEVAIKDPGDETDYRTGSGIGCSYIHQNRTPKSGWPFVGYYTLTAGAADATLLANGFRPVYFRRTVDAIYYDTAEEGFGCGISQNRSREQYLTLLLDPAQDQPLLPIYSYYVIAWFSEPDYVSHLDSLVIDHNRKIAEAVQTLEAAGLLTVEEAATTRPFSRISVLDYRKDKKVSLPLDDSSP